MNRRNFISTLSVLGIGTLVGVGRVNSYSSPEPSDIFEIFSPEEIKRRFGEDVYVPTPVFKKNEITYHVKTHRLNLNATHELIHNYFPKGRSRMCEIQFLAKSDIIYRLQLNYIHSVRFGNSPYDPGPHMGDECRWVYPAYVRGIKI